ncbi:MAG: hypothetical protein COV36_02255 [Alphaproteobacteria bacterium CG11_big_fil_rev_8_21_14_0_20_44_7]|nr:MAG: hypothetical protein COV36_02255 [Alphaproteobacteria bacterium CG11_big_fil_rev_8_21_14_0_20_44_7]
MSLTFEQKIKLETHNAIVLCRGTNSSGKKFWVYIEAEKKTVMQMQQDYDNQKVVNFLDYGKVIKKGISDEIPEDVKRYMEEEHNFKHDEND